MPGDEYDLWRTSGFKQVLPEVVSKQMMTRIEPDTDEIGTTRPSFFQSTSQRKIQTMRKKKVEGKDIRSEKGSNKAQSFKVNAAWVQHEGLTFFPDRIPAIRRGHKVGQNEILPY